MEVTDMTKEALITITIDKYIDLQRIKKNNGSQTNQELDLCIVSLIFDKITQDIRSSARQIFDGVAAASTFHFGPCLACATGT